MRFWKYCDCGWLYWGSWDRGAAGSVMGVPPASLLAREPRRPSRCAIAITDGRPVRASSPTKATLGGAASASCRLIGPGRLVPSFATGQHAGWRFAFGGLKQPVAGFGSVEPKPTVRFSRAAAVVKILKDEPAPNTLLGSATMSVA